MTTFTTKAEAQKELTNVAKTRAIEYLRSEINAGIEFNISLLKMFRIETKTYADALAVVFEPMVKSYIITG